MSARHSVCAASAGTSISVDLVFVRPRPTTHLPARPSKARDASRSCRAPRRNVRPSRSFEAYGPPSAAPWRPLRPMHRYKHRPESSRSTARRTEHRPRTIWRRRFFCAGVKCRAWRTSPGKRAYHGLCNANSDCIVCIGWQAGHGPGRSQPATGRILSQGWTVVRLGDPWDHASKY